MVRTTISVLVVSALSLTSESQPSVDWTGKHACVVESSRYVQISDFMMGSLGNMPKSFIAETGRCADGDPYNLCSKAELGHKWLKTNGLLKLSDPDRIDLSWHTSSIYEFGFDGPFSESVIFYQNGTFTYQDVGILTGGEKAWYLLKGSCHRMAN